MQTQSGEDIDAVLGRFQAWTGSRIAAEVKPGIREPSCEEAVQSGRYRWKASGAKPAKKNPAPGPNRESGIEPVALSELQQGGSKTVSRPLKKKQTRTKQVRAGNNAAKGAPATKSTLAVKTAITPSFRDILVQTVQPAELVKRPVELLRQTAISVRVAPAERALIKTRAIEAGISESAYVRQCALEVEQLRALVQQTLAEMHRGGPASLGKSVSASGFLARIARKFFARRSPALSPILPQTPRKDRAPVFRAVEKFFYQRGSHQSSH